MGMSVGGGKKHLQSEINVVPLVDITLVLLIIFMVMTPMMQRGYDMSIPEKSKVELTTTVAADQMVVIILENGDVLLNKTRVKELGTLRTQIEELLVGRSQKIVFFQAHDNVFYQEAVSVMDAIRAAGGIVGLVTTELG